MRILQFTDGFGAGGKERQLLELLKGLKHTGRVECELVTMSRDFHYSLAEGLEVPIHYLIRRTPKDLGIFARFFRLCQERQPDLVHSWNSMCSVYAVPTAKLQGIPFINGFLRDAPPDFSFGATEWWRAKLTFPFSDAIVANSVAGLRAYRARENKSLCVHNGFDMQRVADLEPPQEVRSRLDIRTEKVVGMVASFSAYKDYPAFIAAAEKVLASGREVTFLGIGDGRHLEECRRKISPAHRDRIRLIGNRTDVESLVNIFTVGVLLSSQIHGEGISNAIMEYMALGKPVVASGSGGNRELILDGTTGFIVERGDIRGLAERITRFLDDPKLCAEFGRKGSRRIREKFNLDLMTSRYVDLYQRMSASKNGNRHGVRPRWIP